MFLDYFRTLRGFPRRLGDFPKKRCKTNVFSTILKWCGDLFGPNSDQKHNPGTDLLRSRFAGRVLTIFSYKKAPKRLPKSTPEGVLDGPQNDQKMDTETVQKCSQNGPQNGAQNNPRSIINGSWTRALSRWGRHVAPQGPRGLDGFQNQPKWTSK